MKISELIKKLDDMKNEDGDLEVYYFPYDWAEPSPLEELSIYDSIEMNKKVVMIGDD
jgi:hypothetical protein